MAGTIVLLDVVPAPRASSVLVNGLLDEPAHLATAWLALCGLAPRALVRPVGWSALVASVAIDVDHIPLYLSDGGFAVNGGRPPTHSLVLVAVLIVGAALLGRRGRWVLGAALGILLHFLRDVATGPGIPALWPFSERTLLVPYWTYLIVVLLLTVVAC